MTGYRRWTGGKIVSFVLITSLLLLVTVSFGHVLGNYYIEKIVQQGFTSNVKESPNKTKVLRLRQFDYYSIQAGAFAEREQAVAAGQVLSQKGFPGIVTGEGPYRLLIGFLNNKEGLTDLARRIQVEGQSSTVIQGQANTIAFRFSSGDAFAEGTMAPYLGKVSLSLEKGLLLYVAHDTLDPKIKDLQPKFSELAGELEEITTLGANIANRKEVAEYQEAVIALSKRSEGWALSLRRLESSWNNGQLLASQQQALALMQDYHRLLAILQE